MFRVLIDTVLVTMKWFLGLFNRPGNRVTADLNILSLYGKNERQLWDFSQYEEKKIVNLIWESPDFITCELLPNKSIYMNYKNVELRYRGDRGWRITHFQPRYG